MDQIRILKRVNEMPRLLKWATLPIWINCILWPIQLRFMIGGAIGSIVLLAIKLGDILPIPWLHIPMCFVVMSVSLLISSTIMAIVMLMIESLRWIFGLADEDVRKNMDKL